MYFLVSKSIDSYRNIMTKDLHFVPLEMIIIESSMFEQSTTVCLLEIWYCPPRLIVKSSPPWLVLLEVKYESGLWEYMVTLSLMNLISPWPPWTTLSLNNFDKYLKQLCSKKKYLPSLELWQTILEEEEEFLEIAFKIEGKIPTFQNIWKLMLEIERESLH